MKAGVNDIGTTEFSSGADEIGKGKDGIFTLLSVRQNLNILGNKVRTRYQEQAITTAQAAVETHTATASEKCLPSLCCCIRDK